MNKDLFIEKILETENLTGELEDDDANRLLNWGIDRVDDLLAGVNDDEVAGDKINDLMALMRQLNRITGSYATDTTVELVDGLARLHDLFIKVFPANPAVVQPASALLEAAAAQIKQDTPSQVLQYLEQWPNWL
jgi:hypothetical protein